MRDVAAEQQTRARATYEDLAADVSEAKATTEQAALEVAKSACAILLEEGAMQGLALKDAWEGLLRQFDRVAVFADCQIHYADTSFSITLPPETASLLHAIAKIYYPPIRTSRRCCECRGLVPLVQRIAEAMRTRSHHFPAASSETVGSKTDKTGFT